jgi:hypothetical protein
MEMLLLTGDYREVASPANSTISKGLQSGPLHLYVDRWCAEVEICPLR